MQSFEHDLDIPGKSQDILQSIHQELLPTSPKKTKWKIIFSAILFGLYLSVFTCFCTLSHTNTKKKISIGKRSYAKNFSYNINSLLSFGMYNL